ncbi:unnamed protein product [Linum trigynum]|uniref:Uncharacterized protein n=1 Tax=Linum trigynum TaxID=586398 RepID=A0AAV2D1P2_9ROSI
MSVFSLTSDDQFIRAKEGSPVISVYTFLDDLKDFGFIFRRTSKQQPRLSTSTRVGPTAPKFKELEVLGVTIGGDRLKELIGDLVLPKESHYLMVNRQGLCLLHAGGPSVAWLRLNDRFGWFKYGVRPAVETGTIWSVWDMSSGAVLVAPPLGRGRGGEDTWEKVVEEKEKEMEAKESLLRETLEEKEKEVVALKAALNALTTAHTVD